MVSVIPRKKVLIPRHSEFGRRANSEARNGTERSGNQFLTGGFFGFFYFFTYDIQHCFICRPSASTVSEPGRMLGSNPGQFPLQHWLSDALDTRHISSTLGYISSTLGYLSSTLGYISSTLSYISSTLGYISSTLSYISSTLFFFSLPRNGSERNSESLLFFVPRNRGFEEGARWLRVGVPRSAFSDSTLQRNFRVVFSSAEGFGRELREFASISVPRNGIPRCFLFFERVRNGIPRISVPRNSRNSDGNNHLFRQFRLPRNYFFVGNSQPYVEMSWTKDRKANRTKTIFLFKDRLG